MQQCNGQRGRVWQRGPVRLVMVSGFVQLRWRRLFCLSWFTVAGDAEVWLGVPGWTGRLWPPAAALGVGRWAFGVGRWAFGDKEHDEEGEHA